MAADIRIPISPIHGMVNTTGDATHPPYIQLKNPSGSLVDVRVYELRFGMEGAQTNRPRMQRTNAPATLAGTVTVGTLARRNEYDATAIQATLKGATANAGFAESVSFWFDKIALATGNGYQEVVLHAPNSYPLIIKPGSALEFCSGDNSAAQLIRLYAVFDEITI